MLYGFGLHPETLIILYIQPEQKQKNTNVIKRKVFEQIAIYSTLGLRLLKDGT